MNRTLLPLPTALGLLAGTLLGGCASHDHGGSHAAAAHRAAHAHGTAHTHGTESCADCSSCASPSKSAPAPASGASAARKKNRAGGEQHTDSTQTETLRSTQPVVGNDSDLRR